MVLFTIGYGGRTADELLALLHDHGVRTIADVRLRPDRASMGIWVRARTSDKGIERVLGSAGIGYQSLVELGNLFLEHPDWREPYRELLARSGDLLTARLRELAGPVCLLCAERRASDCHRTLVAEWVAAHTGEAVVHIE
ncbi:MAG: DUF488 domain-containing protein [Planctomycetes bacterium]|nr:DUF488 domain-containing protein [Planctomycetota bacterium]